MHAAIDRLTTSTGGSNLAGRFRFLLLSGTPAMDPWRLGFCLPPERPEPFKKCPVHSVLQPATGGQTGGQRRWPGRPTSEKHGVARSALCCTRWGAQGVSVPVGILFSP